MDFNGHWEVKKKGIYMYMIDKREIYIYGLLASRYISLGVTTQVRSEA